MLQAQAGFVMAQDRNWNLTQYQMSRFWTTNNNPFFRKGSTYEISVNGEPSSVWNLICRCSTKGVKKEGKLGIWYELKNSVNPNFSVLVFHNKDLMPPFSMKILNPGSLVVPCVMNDKNMVPKNNKTGSNLVKTRLELIEEITQSIVDPVAKMFKSHQDWMIKNLVNSTTSLSPGVITHSSAIQWFRSLPEKDRAAFMLALTNSSSTTTP